MGCRNSRDCPGDGAEGPDSAAGSVDERTTRLKAIKRVFIGIRMVDFAITGMAEFFGAGAFGQEDLRRLIARRVAVFAPGAGAQDERVRGPLMLRASEDARPVCGESEREAVVRSAEDGADLVLARRQRKRW